MERDSIIHLFAVHAKSKVGSASKELSYLRWNRSRRILQRNFISLLLNMFLFRYRGRKDGGHHMKVFQCIDKNIQILISVFRLLCQCCDQNNFQSLGQIMNKFTRAGIGFVAYLTRMPAGVSATFGLRPFTISYNTVPSEYKSDCGLVVPVHCSGDIYSGLPIAIPDSVNALA